MYTKYIYTLMKHNNLKRDEAQECYKLLISDSLSPCQVRYLNRRNVLISLKKRSDILSDLDSAFTCLEKRHGKRHRRRRNGTN